MKATRLTYRYAKSLLKLVIDKNCLDTTLTDMHHILNVCVNSKDLSMLLKSPIIKTDKKKFILSKIFSENISNLTMTFLNIITNKKREMFLEGIAQSFITLYKEYKNIETVALTSASPLDDNTKNQIVSYVKNLGKSDVEMTENIDKEIIGGIIIKMGDKQLDASVKRHIKELRKTFNTNLYIKDY